MVLWVAQSFSLVGGYQKSGWTYRLHLQDWRRCNFSAYSVSKYIAYSEARRTLYDQSSHNSYVGVIIITRVLEAECSINRATPLRRSLSFVFYVTVLLSHCRTYLIIQLTTDYANERLALLLPLGKKILFKKFKNNLNSDNIRRI